MKKLLLSVFCCLLVFNSSAISREKINKIDYLTAEVKSESNLSSKFLLMICYLETADFYKDANSEADFVNSIVSFQFDNGKKPKYFEVFLKYLYSLHARGADYNTIYDSLSIQHINQFKQGVHDIVKNCNGRSAQLGAIYDNTPCVGGKIKNPKNGWLNLFRKILDLLDDEF